MLLFFRLIIPLSLEVRTWKQVIKPSRKKYICQRFGFGGNALSQLLPHHLRIRSGPCSWYSSLDIQVSFKSEVRLNLAIPCQASNAGFLALTISNDISGGSIGRSVACNRGTRPGSWDGAPVKNTFFTKESQSTITVGEENVTFTRRPFSSSVKRARTFWITSPRPAESTPAIEGAK